MNDRLKIIGLRIKNMRKIEALNMEFAERGLIEIRGENEQGKSTILDCLEILIRGNKYLEKDIIQHGQERAEIIGQIGEWEIKRIITQNTNRLEIKNTTGMVMANKPQEFLDSFTNELTFNPFPFLNKTAEEKLKFVMDLFAVNFSEINAQIQELEQERLFVGRGLKAIGKIEEFPKVRRIDLSHLIVFNDEQKDRQTQINLSNDRLTQLISSKKDIEQKIDDLQSKLEVAENDLSECDNRIKRGEKYLEQKPQPEALKETDEAIAQNQEANKYENYLDKKKEHEIEQKKYEKVSTDIQILREGKKKQLANIAIPVDGLEIREDGIYHNDIFSENWSDSEGIKISSELCLGMNPKLKMITIDRGETLGVNRLKALKEWATQNDLQAIITIVDSIPETKTEGIFYIEEGQLIEEAKNVRETETVTTRKNPR